MSENGNWRCSQGILEDMGNLMWYVSNKTCIQTVAWQSNKASSCTVRWTTLMNRKECCFSFHKVSLNLDRIYSDVVSIKGTASVQLPCKLICGIALLGNNVNISSLDHLLCLLNPKISMSKCETQLQKKCLASWERCVTRDASKAQFSWQTVLEMKTLFMLLPPCINYM